MAKLRYILGLVVLTVVSSCVGPTTAGSASHPGEPSPSPISRPVGAAGPYPVLRVVDGDTFRIRRGGVGVTIRVLGIDTPETHDPRKIVQCGGPEAAQRAKQLLTGQQVYLETDTTQATVDKYGRTLAYVWIGGSLYEMTMLREGYAREYTYRTAYRRQAQFRAEQARAKAAGAGLWSAATCNGDTTQPEPSGGWGTR